jgi:hypothetical protein
MRSVMSVILQKLSRAEFLVAKIYGILSDFYSKLVVYYSRISTDVLRLVVEEKLHDEMLKYEELKNAGWKVCRGPLPLSRSLSSAVGLSDGVLVRLPSPPPARGNHLGSPKRGVRAPSAQYQRT